MPFQFCSEETAAKVKYEFAIFDFLCNELAFPCAESASFVPRNVALLGTGHSDADEMRLSALLESLLLHARILLDFFRHTTREQDNLMASDFVSSWSPPQTSGFPYLAGRQRQLNKALAHLAAKRVDFTGVDKKWDVKVIQSEIGKMIQDFKTGLSANQKPWFT